MTQSGFNRTLPSRAACDGQRLKFVGYDNGGVEAARSGSMICDALSLYLNYIHRFQSLLALSGQRR